MADTHRPGSGSNVAVSCTGAGLKTSGGVSSKDPLNIVASALAAENGYSGSSWGRSKLTTVIGGKPVACVLADDFLERNHFNVLIFIRTKTKFHLPPHVVHPDIL